MEYLISKDEAVGFVAQARWQYAKSMPKFPHEYTVREWNNDTEFEQFIHYLLGSGEFRKEYFWKRIYCDLGEWYYWTMGAPIEETTIINRARIDYGAIV